MFHDTRDMYKEHSVPLVHVPLPYLERVVVLRHARDPAAVRGDVIAHHPILARKVQEEALRGQRIPAPAAAAKGPAPTKTTTTRARDVTPTKNELEVCASGLVAALACMHASAQALFARIRGARRGRDAQHCASSVARAHAHGRLLAVGPKLPVALKLVAAHESGVASAELDRRREVGDVCAATVAARMVARQQDIGMHEGLAKVHSGMLAGAQAAAATSPRVRAYQQWLLPGYGGHGRHAQHCTACTACGRRPRQQG